MQYWKCKCGNYEFFGSGMFPQDCQVCDKCGTTLTGRPPVEHDWKPQFDCDTGKPKKSYCKRCYSHDGPVLGLVSPEVKIVEID